LHSLNSDNFHTHDCSKRPYPTGLFSRSFRFISEVREEVPLSSPLIMNDWFVDSVLRTVEYKRRWVVRIWLGEWEGL